MTQNTYEITNLILEFDQLFHLTVIIILDNELGGEVIVTNCSPLSEQLF